MAGSNEELMTFGEHLDVFRKMLFRILGVLCFLSICIFCFKSTVFSWLLAPHESSFCTFKWIHELCNAVGLDFNIQSFKVRLISTELSAQFMTHLSTSVYLGFLTASPYIVYELFAFIAPALYHNERRIAKYVVVAVYILFILGVMMSYFIIFPISFRFLATYQVTESIENVITLQSYISNFVALTFLMGLVFQMPVLTYFLGKFGFISRSMLKSYRRHALIVIVTVAAFITPPDMFSLFLVALPMYSLYEVSIWLVKN